MPATAQFTTASTDSDTFEDILARADRVADELRLTAAARDHANQEPRAELEILRENDLLQILEPVEYGGAGLSFAQAAQVVRHIARGDTSIAHVLGYHYSHSRIDGFLATPEQADRQSRRNAGERLFWGGVHNPRGGSDITLTHGPEGYRLNGRRSFASGASLADQITINASYKDGFVFVSIPAGRPGFKPLGDWDNIGQRLTASGGVEVVDLEIGRSEILGPDPIDPGRVLTPYQTLLSPLFQLVFINFYIGTAEGALDEAIQWTRDHGAAWESSGVERATDDPYVQQTVGELVSEVHAAALLADHAGEQLQQAFDVGEELTAQQRGEAAVVTYQAKYLSSKVAVETTSRLFEIQGARATTSAYGFDRHWRNIRTHSLHDPAAYRAKEVGDFSLNGTVPEFSLYR
jgi:alkylation response protein AidB-like acyl-CoA dehydrogenase